MLRKCSKCGEEKEIDRFVRQTGKYREDPYRKDCKDCKNAKRRKNTISSTIFVKGQKAWNKGIKADPEIIKKMIEGRKGQVTWNKGKIYGKGRTITCGKYKEWRLSVLKRDEYKCRKCRSEKKLHCHHIIPWNKDENLRFDIENGMTLCSSCHAKEEGFKKGHRQSEEERKKMSLSKKGKAPWNKGIKNGFHDGR